MKGFVDRHIVARELGRRVSRGEFERIFSKLYPIRSTVQSDKPWRPTGAKCFTYLMHPASPKSRRKHGHSWHTIIKGKRARFNKAVK